MKSTHFVRCLILMMAIFVCTRSVHASSIGLTFAGGDSWTATWFDPGLTLVYTPGTPNVLVETLIMSTGNPVDITFTENSPATADFFGLRFTMSQAITNNTGVAWTGFNEQLIEGAPAIVAPGNSALHPSSAHFHTDAGFSGSPFSLTGGGNSQNSLVFGGATLPNGVTWNASGIGTHEWQVTGFQRSFILRQTPVLAAVPEPSTLLLCLGGLPFAYRKCREHLRTRGESR